MRVIPRSIKLAVGCSCQYNCYTISFDHSQEWERFNKDIPSSAMENQDFKSECRILILCHLERYLLQFFFC